MADHLSPLGMAGSDAAPASTGEIGARRDRYGAVPRVTGAVLVGVIAGGLLVNSMQVGALYVLAGFRAVDWTSLVWDDHWVWRGVASAAATAAAGFLAGMVARRHGARVAMLSAAPSALYWLAIAYMGWTGRSPFWEGSVEIPLGYRIVAIILAIATLPIASSTGAEGAPYGRANAEHFDARRGSLLGIRWFHFLWLPFLLHAMVLTAAFGAMYGFQWIVIALKGGGPVMAIIPMLFAGALMLTLALLSQGAFGTYKALAGFDDELGRPVWKRVLIFGFGYTIATMVAQAGITAIHLGLGALIEKLRG